MRLLPFEVLSRGRGQTSFRSRNATFGTKNHPFLRHIGGNLIVSFAGAHAWCTLFRIVFSWREFSLARDCNIFRMCQSEWRRFLSRLIMSIEESISSIAILILPGWIWSYTLHFINSKTTIVADSSRWQSRCRWTFGNTDVCVPSHLNCYLKAKNNRSTIKMGRYQRMKLIYSFEFGGFRDCEAKTHIVPMNPLQFTHTPTALVSLLSS